MKMNSPVIAILIAAANLAVLGTCSSSTKELYFGLVIGDENNEALSGVQAALKEINERSDILSGYELKYERVYSQVNYSVFFTCMAYCAQY